MANSASARKRARQTVVRTERNRAAKSRIKTFRKHVLAAVEAKDLEKAKEAYSHFSSAADKAAKRGVIHKNTASRLKSRVAAQVNSLSAA